MNNIKCFYHSADLDGHCSGAIVKIRYPECQLFGIDHGQQFPWDEVDTQDTVIMVDFSLQPFSDMIKLKEKCKELIWIDHHKTAIDEYNRNENVLISGLRKIGRAGCELTWDYLCPGIDIPLSVYYLGRYDVWDHSNENTLSFQYGMRLEDTNPNNIDFWMKRLVRFDRGLSAIKDRGKIVLNYIKMDNKKYVDACAFPIIFEGFSFIAVNKMLTNSQLFDSIYDENKYDGMLTFGWRNRRWVVSMYSNNKSKPIDCGEIARKYGGGGHVGAAGFQCEKLPFELG